MCIFVTLKYTNIDFGALSTLMFTQILYVSTHFITYVYNYPSIVWRVLMVLLREPLFSQ